MPDNIKIIKGKGNQPGVVLVDLPTRPPCNTSSTVIQFPDIGSNLPGDTRVMNWGPGNNFPAEAKKLICGDQNAMQIIDKKVNLNLGQGLTYYIERRSGNTIEKEFPAIGQIDDFLGERESEIMEVLRRADTNKEYYGMFHVEFLLGQFKDRLASIQTIDGDFIRPISIPKGYNSVQNFVLNPSQSAQTNTGENPLVIPCHQRFWKKLDRKNVPYKFIVCGADWLPGQPYFGVPRWFGSKKNLEYSCLIMESLIAGAKNGWNIRYLLELDDRFYDGCENERERADKKQKLVTDLNRLFSGAQNSGKVLAADMYRDHQGKATPGVKVTELNKSAVDSNVTKLLEMQEKSKSTGFGFDPGLAGIDTGKNIASGSDIRNKYLLYLAMCAPNSRRELTKIMEVISWIYGWDTKIKWGFRDIEMVTLDEDKRGYQQTDAA